ncbi:MAG: phosphatidylglycerol lysyltransferase domain-containing protein [Melioribacteraceae bacterium]
MQTLPLSWSLETNKTETSVTAKYLGEKLKWLSVCSFANHTQFYNLIDYSLDKQNQNLIIRGCNRNIVEYLKIKGYSATMVGMEAVLETSGNHFEKKSIKQIVKRGLRHGSVIELPYSYNNAQQLEDFKTKTIHAAEPQLENLFQTKFTEDNSLYVLVSKKNIWLGAILVSKNGSEKLHTELILRTKDSPVGVLESILEKIFSEAKNNGMLELSLGEVPFVNNGNNGSIISSSYILRKFGRLLKFAYAYDGLYNFKNKFQPRWDDLYVCSKPKIGFEHLVFLFVKSNFHKLVFYKIKSKMKRQKNITKKQNSSNYILPLLDFN